MSYEKDFYDYIRKNKKALTTALRIPYDMLGNEDLRILCNYATYKAGAEHYRDQGGAIDPSMLDGVRVFFSRARKEGNVQEHIQKAFRWFEQGALNHPNLSKALYDQPTFSPAVERYLQKRRDQNYRDSFRKFQENIHGLNENVRGLLETLRSDEPISNDEMAMKIKQQLNRISTSMQRCDRSAKGGLAWAKRANIPMDKACAGVRTMYIDRLPELEKAVENCESFLRTQGFRSTIVGKTRKRYQGWSRDLEEIVRKERKQERQYDRAESVAPSL